ncbi:hypothetical protein ATW55_00690 [Ferroacidibacillus organovorans]|uniref:Uncharacterized protein n=1 Tax=Ferroacidibacillus organovorans TaxID=1765683 RepID=A0A101XRW9_9BACL|nr:hypothetical protein ATW55_00690 [Ferroacidibacillus organovorans]
MYIRTATIGYSGITSHGTLKVSGFLNSENVTINLYGPSRVSEIGAGILRIEKEADRSILSRFKTISAKTIQGDEIYLEYTKANIVRGNRVFIGVRGHIDLVEYRTEFEQHKKAQLDDDRNWSLPWRNVPKGQNHGRKHCGSSLTSDRLRVIGQIDVMGNAKFQSAN